MPTCQNCGSHVTNDYVRVFVPDESTPPECCPECPDLIRDKGTGQPRKSKAAR